MKGTLSRGDIEWHDGGHDLYDQLLDDCAGKMEEYVKGGPTLEGPVTALPGGLERRVPCAGRRWWTRSTARS
eukprot:2258523-Amphidinium_carterae.1